MTGQNKIQEYNVMEEKQVNIEINQGLELSGKDFNVTIIKILQQTNINFLEIIKNRKISRKQMSLKTDKNLKNN